MSDRETFWWQGGANDEPPAAAVEPTRETDIESVERVAEARRIGELHNKYKSDPSEPWAAMIINLCDSHELLRAQLAEATRDRDRLDAISQVGARTRVAMNATKNQANPPMRAFAEVSLPAVPHASYISSSRTLREAIDAARVARPEHGEKS
jgi:hypothetical protein